VCACPKETGHAPLLEKYHFSEEELVKSVFEMKDQALVPPELVRAPIDSARSTLSLAEVRSCSTDLAVSRVYGSAPKLSVCFFKEVSTSSRFENFKMDNAAYMSLQ
jgi:hypothetical protein